MDIEKQPAVYIVASKRNGTIYTGVTSALWTRIATHKQGEIAGFTQDYKVNQLVWYEHFETMEAAIKREKQIKKWYRIWKLNLIEAFNPEWLDLHDHIEYRPSLGSRMRGNDEIK